MGRSVMVMVAGTSRVGGLGPSMYSLTLLWYRVVAQPNDKVHAVMLQYQSFTGRAQR